MSSVHINLSALEAAVVGAQAGEQTVSLYQVNKGNTPETIAMSTATYLANLALRIAGLFDSLDKDVYWGPVLKAMSFYNNFDSMLKQWEKPPPACNRMIGLSGQFQILRRHLRPIKCQTDHPLRHTPCGLQFAPLSFHLLTP